MGSTRGTPASIDRGIDRMMMRDHPPQSLTAAELDLEHEPVTKPPRALPCTAWVRYGVASICVDGLLLAWTDRAAAVQWRTPDDRVDRAWLWRSAVSPRA
jgi:hypothetical protein